MEVGGRGIEPVMLLWYHQSEFYHMYHQHIPASGHVFQVSLVFSSLLKHAEIVKINQVKSTGFLHDFIPTIYHK
jgi:hypothetical protein